MIKLEHVVLASPEQMEFVIEGMRNPFNSWDRSDSEFECHNIDICPDCGDTSCDKCPGWVLGTNDLHLAGNLSKAGTDHRKYMRMMPVYVRISAPLYWWKEFDTYKVGTVANSCSTMHKIQEKEFTLEDFSCEKMYNRTLKQLKLDIVELNYWRDIFLNGGGHDLPEDLPLFMDEDDCVNDLIELNLSPKAKEAWWQMIQLLSTSYNQTRNVMMNYEVCANIYGSRRHHKMGEGHWDVICQWIETLPYSELIIGEN